MSENDVAVLIFATTVIVVGVAGLVLQYWLILS